MRIFNSENFLLTVRGQLFWEFGEHRRAQSGKILRRRKGTFAPVISTLRVGSFRGSAVYDALVGRVSARSPGVFQFSVWASNDRTAASDEWISRCSSNVDEIFDDESSGLLIR